MLFDILSLLKNAVAKNMKCPDLISPWLYTGNKASLAIKHKINWYLEMRYCGVPLYLVTSSPDSFSLLHSSPDSMPFSLRPPSSLTSFFLSPLPPLLYYPPLYPYRSVHPYITSPLPLSPFYCLPFTCTHERNFHFPVQLSDFCENGFLCRQ